LMEKSVQSSVNTMQSERGQNALRARCATQEEAV
jgi:hypothetical protein